MPHPKGGYSLDGEKIPGVTTIISRFKESGGLIHWAWKQGADGLDYRETKQKAADAGTCAHDMFECWKLKKKFDPSGYDAQIVVKARGAYSAFLEWAEQTKLEIDQTELSLISKKYRYGGTLDAMLVNGKRSLGDYKTSNAIYIDYLIQGGAYNNLWNENYPDDVVTGGFHLLRFSKQEHPDDPVSFAHHYWSDVKLATEQFLLLRKAFDNDKRLKGLL